MSLKVITRITNLIHYRAINLGRDREIRKFYSYIPVCLAHEYKDKYDIVLAKVKVYT